MRESPTFALMDELKRRGAAVDYHDQYIPVVTPTREHGHWTGTKSVEWTRNVLSSYDAVRVATAHTNTDFRSLAE
jgi:UDP-N-acetyl-D-glucosamine dehydrogenase